MVIKSKDVKTIFEDFLVDGRLTEPNSEIKYRLREAIEYSNKIGRLLTPEEMSLFEVSEK